MVVVNLTAGATTNSTPIAFTQLLNTNSDVSVVDNSLVVKKPGIYEIIGVVTFQSEAEGEYTMSMYNGTTQIGDTINVSATAADLYQTSTLYSVQQIDVAESGNVTLTFETTGTPSVYGGNISIKRLV